MLWIILAVAATLLLFIVVEILIIKYSGTEVPAPSIPRGPQTLGSGPKLTYVVMGDSTSIGQGADYNDSYAVDSAKQLAKHSQIQFVNVGVSGAVTSDVVRTQLSQAASYKPDIVLLAVGANDARTFVSGRAIQTALHQIIDDLKKANPSVQIVVTGSPAMDTVPRFPWPSNKLMGLRTRQVNRVFAPIIKSESLIFAPIADKTRAAFLADPTLFAADEFHPNARGYAVWKPVINDALDQALARSHR